MDIRTGYDRNYGKWFAGDVLRACRRYGLIPPGETVCVGLSGGLDSITLLYILHYLAAHSHLDFKLIALHIRTADYGTSTLRDYCRALGVPYFEEALESPVTGMDTNACALCARLRRGAVSAFLAREGLCTVALGHHADDVAETLFLNLFRQRKLGSFSPRVSYADNPLTVIRPLIYLERRRLAALHRHAGLPLLDHTCPHAATGNRARVREMMQSLGSAMDTAHPGADVVAALENLDRTNLWDDLVVS